MHLFTLFTRPFKKTPENYGFSGLKIPNFRISKIYRIGGYRVNKKCPWQSVFRIQQNIYDA